MITAAADLMFLVEHYDSLLAQFSPDASSTQFLTVFGHQVDHHDVVKMKAFVVFARDHGHQLSGTFYQSLAVNHIHNTWVIAPLRNHATGETAFAWYQCTPLELQRFATRMLQVSAVDAVPPCLND